MSRFARAAIRTRILAACREQSTGIQEVNTAVVAMNHLVQTSTAMIAQSTSVAEGLRKEAQSLALVVARFNVGERPVSKELAQPPGGAGRAPQRHLADPAPGAAQASSEDEVAQAVVRDFFESLKPPFDGARRRD